RMAGMDDMEALEGGEEDSAAAQEEGRDFESKSLPTRALVIAAGVIMNFLFAWFLYAVIGMAWGVRESPPPVVADVVEERVPEGAGALLDISPGSRIVAVNGNAVASFDEAQRRMAMAPETVTLSFEDGTTVAVPVPSTDSARADLALSLEPALAVDPVIGQVVEASAAEVAGMEAGDRVVEVAGQPVTTWQEFVAGIEGSPGAAVPLIVERDGQRVTLEVVPEARAVPSHPDRQVGRIGVTALQSAAAAYPRERLGPVAAIGHGAQETWTITVTIIDYLVGLFTGDASPRDVGGPILIYQLSEQVVQVGLDAFLNFMALFSVNLAILNLLPIPILDGGQLLFLAVEGVRGRPLTVEQRMRLSQVGLVMVVMIMVWALANDILRLFGL
ncbi:MAG TPA: RIP metalloprotease RseP, partial [Longimicrobiales bacterium]|nr:RIP metalloprotease RseP [Longimicrobiales bacterium]